MKTGSRLHRTSTESSDHLTANIQRRSFETGFDRPQPQPYDLSQVDLFSHAPQRPPVQAKLTVGAPNDVYEQEADRVAEQVMSMPDSAAQTPVQRESAPEEEDLQTKPLATTITPVIQREAMPEEEEPVQAKLVQREAVPEEEEPVQAKLIQREGMPEEEEPVQAKLIQREGMPEEEEVPGTPGPSSTATPTSTATATAASSTASAPLGQEEELQMKSLGSWVQRESMPEEEEPVQAKLIQREGMPEEEEAPGTPGPSSTATPTSTATATAASSTSSAPLGQEEELQMKSLGSRVQRESMPEEEEPVQAKPLLQRAGSLQTGSNLENQLNSSKGGGSPLPDSVRSFMEPRFGTDFSQVRVHTGDEAVQMNQDLNAQAFTHRQDIYFGAGKAPGNDALTAHELTHVVQQTGSIQTKEDTAQSDSLGKLTQLTAEDQDSKKKEPQAETIPQVMQVGTASTTEKILSNGQRQLVSSMPFTQVISRTEASSLEDQENQVGEPVFIDEIPSQQEEVEALDQDSVSATLNYLSQVTRGGATPSGFGITRSSASLTNVSISSSGGAYIVNGNFEYTITWQVRSGTGPAGQIDIQDENDADIKACNYQLVAKDLTPDMGDLNGRPPRSRFWAEDLTERHELYHANDRNSFGPQGATAAQNWLRGQTATSTAQIQNALLPQALTEGLTVINALMAAPPGKEERAYGDGAPLYQARASAIKAKGDTDGYGRISTQVTVHPRGGGSYEIVSGDTLWGIAERTYGHGRYWHEIYAANPGKSRDGGNLIFPGTILTLPLINISQELSAILSFGGAMVFTSSVTVPGGGSHEFFSSPIDLFPDTINCSGAVNVDIVDPTGAALLTTVWNVPGTSTSVNGNYEATIGIVP